MTLVGLCWSLNVAGEPCLTAFLRGRRSVSCGVSNITRFVPRRFSELMNGVIVGAMFVMVLRTFSSTRFSVGDTTV